MRAREFVMKDAYSFHVDEASLAEGYRKMYDAYSAIFTRLGLRFVRCMPTRARSAGAPRRNSTSSPTPARTRSCFRTATATRPTSSSPRRCRRVSPARLPKEKLREVPTPGARTIADVAKLLSLPASRLLKTLVVEGVDGGLVALLLRGDHELNALKAASNRQSRKPLRMADAARIAAAFGSEPGFLGPVGLKLPVIADHAAAAVADFVCGANKADAHLAGRQLGPRLARGRLCGPAQRRRWRSEPGGPGRLSIARGIEVGHIFQLGQKYSESMRATVQDVHGRDIQMFMGCYGIRSHAHRRRRDRAEPRRARHRMAGAARAVPGGRRGAQLGEVAPVAMRQSAFTASCRTAASKCCSTIAMPGPA
jgi:prolyl-tRNA synthetase